MDSSDKRDQAASYFDSDGQIQLTRFTPDDFEASLLEKKKDCGHQHAQQLFQCIKGLVSAKISTATDCVRQEFDDVFWGLKRLQADKYQSGPKDSGKDPLPYSLYQQLCKATLQLQDASFAHFFLTTQRNMMCRSESVQTLCTQHLSAHDDSIRCTMHKSKTNQEGSAPKNPRHMYANPMSPASSWVTALATFLACRPTQRPGPLFFWFSSKTCALETHCVR
ncbi:hypothetical protein JG688_00017869 [Phytophthora aleatoria]|uniref:Uncharacterized protein n=1 Tax=Phytophthora aleatoria TaxID=2496075 RepID=A0A8J5IS51_9STRA|nr:hypothetical protein JG688_00017869 [Phytophthora aleatoria]